MENSMVIPQTLKLELLYVPAIPPQGMYPDKTIIQQDTCTPLFTGAPFTITKTWKQSKCPSTDEWIKKMQKKHNGLLAIKKNKIMSFAATRMDLEIIILNEARKIKTNTV